MNQRKAQAAKSKGELVLYYQKAREAMKRAAADVQTAAIIKRRDQLKASIIQLDVMIDFAGLWTDFLVTADVSSSHTVCRIVRRVAIRVFNLISMNDASSMSLGTHWIRVNVS